MGKKWILECNGTVTTAGNNITAIDRTTTSIIIDGAIRHNSGNRWYCISWFFELRADGLGGIIDDKLALQTLNPATYFLVESKSICQRGTARPISDALLRLVMDETSIVSGKETDSSDGFAWYVRYEAVLNNE